MLGGLRRTRFAPVSFFLPRSDSPESRRGPAACGNCGIRRRGRRRRVAVNKSPPWTNCERLLEESRLDGKAGQLTVNGARCGPRTRAHARSVELSYTYGSHSHTQSHSRFCPREWQRRRVARRANTGKARCQVRRLPGLGAHDSFDSVSRPSRDPRSREDRSGRDRALVSSN